MLIGVTGFEGGARPAQLFEVGELVHHRLYKYRGVVVAMDPKCLAGEKWYHSNKTQPPKDQPWYHVLVHDSGGLSTYVAQSNLEKDASGDPIEHPRLGQYFGGFEKGRYIAHPAGSGGCSV